MTRETFTIPTSDQETVEKKLAACAKKADKYGIPFAVTFGDPYKKEVSVWERDEFGVEHRTETIFVEVVDLTIESEIIEISGYTVRAMIEHLDGGNVVTTFGEGTEIDPRWAKLPPKCDHCGTNHSRKVTFIVRHEDGTEKQVGKSCLKDYCGIDPQMIGWWHRLTDITIGEYDVERIHFDKGTEKVFEIVDALALAVKIINKQGYIRSDEPGSNKFMMLNQIGINHPEETEIAEAKEIAAAIAGMDQATAIDAGLQNVRAMILSGYCKKNHFGYIAYAPIGYRKYVERIARKAKFDEAKRTEAETSQWIGTVGERIDIDVQIRLLTSWDTQFGTTYLYKMTDANGNVLIWFASKCLDSRIVKGRVRGTIKDHTERDGVKQTVLTRCKVA